MTQLNKYEIRKLYDKFNLLARGEAGHSSEYTLEDGNTIRFWFHIGAGANHWLAWDEQQKKASEWFNEMEENNWHIEASRSYRENNTNFEKWDFPLETYGGKSLGHFSVEIEVVKDEETEPEENLRYHLRRNLGGNYGNRENPLADELHQALLNVLDKREEKFRKTLSASEEDSLQWSRCDFMNDMRLAYGEDVKPENIDWDENIEGCIVALTGMIPENAYILKRALESWMNAKIKKALGE